MPSFYCNMVILFRFRANLDHISQSRPDPGLGVSHLQCENLKTHFSCCLPARQPMGSNVGIYHLETPTPKEKRESPLLEAQNASIAWKNDCRSKQCRGSPEPIQQIHQTSTLQWFFTHSRFGLPRASRAQVYGYLTHKTPRPHRTLQWPYA